MYWMALKVYICAEAPSGINTFLCIFSNFCKEMNKNLILGLIPTSTHPTAQVQYSIEPFAV
jgi:hypothetical protein